MTATARAGTALAFGLTLLTAQSAWACSLALDYPPREHPYGTAFPTNGVFMGAHDEWEIDGLPIEVVPDSELSALLGREVWRPVRELPAGVELVKPCGSIEGACGRATVGDGPDLLAPSRPLLDVHITLVDGGNDGSGFSCLEPDVATLTVSGLDGAALEESAPDGSLTLLAYVAQTVEAVDALEAPTAVLGSGTPDEAFRNDLYLGYATGRSMSSVFEHPSFCVAAVVMDAAGNLSERSETVCIDTLDRTAETTTVVAGSGCSVSHGAASSSGGWLFLAALLALLARRPRRP